MLDKSGASRGGARGLSVAMTAGVAGFLLLNAIAFGEYAGKPYTDGDVYADTWVATDGAGRAQPDIREAGPVKPGKQVGLGIPLLAQAAREGGGKLTIESGRDGGTHLLATFKLSHPDTKPLGDVEGTIRMMRYTHPNIEFVYNMENRGKEEHHEA